MHTRLYTVTCILTFFLTYQLQYARISSPPGQLSPMESRWTGQLTLEERFTGLSGTSIRTVKVQFTNALPTLYRNDPTTDLDFTDDKGTGTVSYHAEGMIGTRKVSVTDCDGRGKSELHEVVVDERENTYRIHAIGPACNGTATDLLEGKTEVYGPENTDIIVSDQSLTNKRVLSGTKTEVIDLGGDLGTVNRTITWSLSRDLNDAVLIVTPENYDNWMPEPGKDESSPGKLMNISLKIQARNGGPSPVKATEFILQLSGTSREPGIALNYPVTDPKTTPDLQFQWQMYADTSAEGQQLEIHLRNPGVSASARIAAFDGGGYTTLSVTAILEDNTELRGSLLVPNGEQLIRIPKRMPGDKIATAWLTANNNPGESADEDALDGNPNKGDGLSAYEEYRGVICEYEFGARHPAKFGRLDPWKMNLGLKVDKAELPFFAEGIKWFENGTHIKVLRFNEREIGGDRRLNKNGASAHIYDQYTLLLYKGLLAYAGGPLGITYTSSMNPEIPANTQNIVIDPGAVQREYDTIANRARPAPLPFTRSELLANTIAHELCHGVNVWHHGEEPPIPRPLRKATLPDQSPYYTFRVFDRAGNPVNLPYEFRGRIGIAGGLQSGDLSCIMAYNPYYNWAYTRGADLARIYNQVPIAPIGNKICTSALGTGFNHSIIYFGDASPGRGNCLQQIKLKP